MAPWNINRATWLKFLADSWTYESATGEPPVPFANSADDGLCDPLTAEQAVEWVTKTKFQVVALPGGRKGRGGNEAENVLLLAHNFVLETLEEQDEEEVTLFLAMAGLGDEASPISIDLNKLSSPLSEYISFKEENEEDQGLESLRPPSFKQFLEAPLDSEDLIGLKGKKMSTRTGTKIGWLLEKGSAITLTPYLIQEVLQEFYEDENTSLMRISARELLYGFCKMVKMQVDSKSLTAKKAQEKYFHHLLFLWTLAQPEVVIEQYPFSSYHPDDFVFDMDTEDPLRQLAKIIKLKSKWQENIKGQEEESGDEVGKKTPARMMKKKESGEEKKQEKDRATSDLSGDESEDETETGRDKLVAKKRKAKAVQSSDDSSSDEEPEVDFDEMYRDALAQIKDPVQRLKFMGERESLKIQQRQMKRQKKAARYAKQTRNFTENQTAHLKNQADTMAEMKELQIKENQRKKMEKSVIKKWTVENRTLLKRLSSIDFQEEGEPSPTALARETFMESQNFGNAHKRFETASARWAFKIIPSGFAQLVSSGFYNPNVSADPFAGLSCLIFCPDHALSEMESKEGRMRLLAQALAETKLTDDAIKELARKEIYVPRSGEDGVNDVINALSAAMWTAENYLGARSIGTIPYRYALNWVVRNRLDFRDAEAESIQEQFFLRFLHRVDKMFHDFCTILLRCEGERPMEQAREKLENFCGEEFKTAFGGLARGDMPCLLRLPRLIGFQLLGQKSSRANRSNTGGGGPRSGGRSDSPETGRGKGQRDRPQEEKPKDQWMRCSEKIPDAWKLPSGKNYADALGRRAPKSHKEGFPTFPHHSDKKKGECAPCPRYLVLGTCSFGTKCNQSHPLPSKMPRDKREAFESRLKEIYDKL